jgi:hypothetical protein
VHALRPTLLVLALLLSAFPAATRAQSGTAPAPGPTGIVVSGTLGGGVEVGSSDSTGQAELEVTAGWDLGSWRPELGLLLGLAPGSYAGIRPGARIPLPDSPFYARAALDWAHQGGDWHLRWLFVGAGAELRLTSVLGLVAEADAGVPLTSERGIGLLARAGFTFRF